MNMKDWEHFLVQFLELTDYPILKDKGKISMLDAKLKSKMNMINSELFKMKIVYQTSTSK